MWYFACNIFLKAVLLLISLKLIATFCLSRHSISRIFVLSKNLKKNYYAIRFYDFDGHHNHHNYNFNFRQSLCLKIATFNEHSERVRTLVQAVAIISELDSYPYSYTHKLHLP